MKKNKILNEYLLTALGTVIFSFGLYFFMFPQNLSAGGIAGYAMIISSYISVPISLITFSLNISLLIIGFIFVGPSYGGKTICSILTLSSSMFLMEKFVQLQKPLTNEIFFNLICGIIITTFGVSIVFNQNASTCGTDVIATILKKYLGINMGIGLFLANSVVIIGSYYSYGLEIAAFNAFACMLNSTFINFFLDGFNSKKEVTIVTKKLKEVQKFIVENLKRGLTIYRAEGGYSGENKKILVTIVDRHQYLLLKKELKMLDCDAFLVTRNSKEVLGNGFDRL
ncbi:MAG: YitT family protein [Oscillospiraceae bacterium]